MDFYNTQFYDNASSEYSKNRYDGKPKSYIQFFFQRRLALVLSLVEKYLPKREGLVILEDGCADGIVLRKIQKSQSNKFAKMIGVDISPKMIEVAKNKSDSNIEFYLKEKLESRVIADYLLAVGFVSSSILEAEFDFIEKHLASNGICIISLVSKNSIYSKLKLKNNEIVNDYRSYSEYTQKLQGRFVVIESVGYGVFMPLLWKIPFIALPIQYLFEILLKPFSSLFHEKLYVLRKK